MRLAADRWEVLLTVPRDIGDLGLHQSENLAAAHFRRQLAEELGEEYAARVGPAAEHEFRKARAVHAGNPVLWGGFIMTATPAAAGLPVDTSQWPQDPAQRAELTELAASQNGMLISLTVGVRELVVPDMPLAPAAAVSRALMARFGDDAQVHLVSYGDVPAVAVVRNQTVNAGQAQKLGYPVEEGEGADGRQHRADKTPVADYVLAEVNLLFPDDGALVTVTAATPNYGAVNDAVLLAGTIARSIRVRSADAKARTAAPPADAVPVVEPPAPEAAEGPAGASAPPADAPAAVPLTVLLPNGQPLPEGLTLLGRAPRSAAEQPADHTVTLPDTSISRAHLALRVADGAVTAIDLHSTNGTQIRRRDEVPTTLVPGEETPLAAGDELSLGTARLRVVELPSEAAVLESGP